MSGIFRRPRRGSPAPEENAQESDWTLRESRRVDENEDRRRASELAARDQAAENEARRQAAEVDTSRQAAENEARHQASDAESRRQGAENEARHLHGEGASDGARDE
jgi:hypothetical protein